MRILVLEDDEVAQLIWRRLLREYYPGAETTFFPTVDQMVVDYGSLEKVGEQFELIIADIFLSGDITGIEFIKAQPKKVQQRTIITSSVPPENLETFCRENDLICKFVPKPLNKICFIRAIKSIEEVSDRSFAGALLDLPNRVRFPSRHRNRTRSLPVYLVTGCSSGVGAALVAKLIQRRDCRLVMTARPESLSKLKQKYSENNRLMILPMDVTDPDQIRQVVLTVLHRWGGIDVLINNAGVCYRSAVEQMDSAAEAVQFHTNYLGPLMLIRTVVSGMRERGTGHIINVSSVSGIMGMPTMGSYSASKHAIEGLSESLWYELRPFGIHVSVVRPGFINNQGHAHVISSNKAILAEKLNGPYARFYAFMCPFITQLMRLSPQTSEDIAQRILSLVQKKKPPLWVNTTLDAYVFSILRWLLPEFVFYKIFDFFFRKVVIPNQPATSLSKLRLQRKKSRPIRNGPPRGPRKLHVKPS